MAKKKRSKASDLLFVLVLILIAIAVSAIYGWKTTAYSIDGSALSAQKKGLSIWKDTLMQMGVDVSVNVNPVTHDDVLHLVVKGDDVAGLNVIIEAIEELEDDYILIDMSTLNKLFNESISESSGSYTIVNGRYLQNNAIAFERERAYEITDIVLGDLSASKTIVFEESHIQDKQSAPNWLSVVPVWMKLGLLQLFFALVMYFWYKGKRLGKAVVDFDEVERTQDEFFWAASRYYEYTECGDKMLLAYQRKLKSLLPNDMSRRVMILEKAGVRSVDAIMRILELSHEDMLTMNEKQLLNTVETVKDTIRKLAEKRLNND